MSKLRFAQIVPCNHKVPLTHQLKFNGQNLNVLAPVLKSSMAIEESADFSKITITFFHDSIFAQTLCYEQLAEYDTNHLEIYQSDKTAFLDLFPNKQKGFSHVSKVVSCYPSCDQSNLCPNKLDLQFSSWFIRNSFTIKPEDLIETDNQFKLFDGKGLFVFDKYGGAYQRQILLFMLGFAYSLALQSISNQLSELAYKEDNLKQLNQLYMQAATFNAKYYFHNPILFSRYPTFKDWEYIRNIYQLNEQNQEILTQLSQTHQIISYIKEAKAQQKRDKLNTKLSIITVILFVFGIIEVAHILLNW